MNSINNSFSSNDNFIQPEVIQPEEEFFNYLFEKVPSLVIVSTYLPKGMSAVEINKHSGEFTINYKKKQEGSFKHKKLGNIKVVTKQTVTGRIDFEGKKIIFKDSSLTAKKGVTIECQEIASANDIFQLKGNSFIKKNLVLNCTMDEFMDYQITWEQKK